MVLTKVLACFARTSKTVEAEPLGRCAVRRALELTFPF
jgi:hypothetical protein